MRKKERTIHPLPSMLSYLLKDFWQARRPPLESTLLFRLTVNLIDKLASYVQGFKNLYLGSQKGGNEREGGRGRGKGRGVPTCGKPNPDALACRAVRGYLPATRTCFPRIKVWGRSPEMKTKTGCLVSPRGIIRDKETFTLIIL